MFKKLILALTAAFVMMVASQGSASAAIAVAKPAPGAKAPIADIIKVGRRRGGRHRGGRRRFHHRRWRGRYRGRHHRWHRRHYSRGWSWYRRCKWKQRRGYRIYCPKPTYY